MLTAERRDLTKPVAILAGVVLLIAISERDLVGDVFPSPATRAGEQTMDSPLASGGVSGGEGAARTPVALGPGEVLEAALEQDDVSSLVTAQLALFEDAWGDQLTYLGPEDGSEDEWFEWIPISPTDVNGDGREDVLYFDIRRNPDGTRSEVRIVARDGGSGAVLWQRSYGTPYELWVLSPGDLTGDWAEDLVVMSTDLSRRPASAAPLPCSASTCAYDNYFDYARHLTIVSGRSGSPQWDEHVDGLVRYTGAYAFNGPAVTEVARIQATTGLVDLRLSGDVDGDGLADLLLNEYDFEGPFLYNARVRDTDLTFVTHASARSGVSGNTILSKSTEAQPGPGLLLPAGPSDATSSGLYWVVEEVHDLPTVCHQLVAGPCTQDVDASLAVELLRAEDHQAVWRAEVTGDDVAAVWPLASAHDLTGDSQPDLLIGQRNDGGAERLSALAGRDGRQLWSRDTIIADPPTSLGPVGGGPGTDLMFWEGWNPADTEAPGILFRVRLRRVHGATGRDLLVTERDLHDVSEKLDTIFAFPVGDVDGDGTPDVSFAVWHYDGSWEPDGSASSRLIVESGSDGRTLLILDRSRKALLFPGGRLALGGAEDLLEASQPYDESDLSVGVVAMPHGHVRWSRLDAELAAAHIRVAQTRVGDSLVYVRSRAFADPIHLESRIDMLDGRSGRVLWAAGSELD